MLPCPVYRAAQIHRGKQCSSYYPCYPLLWELIEFLKALEVPLLAARLGFESEAAEHVGKCLHCVIFFSHLVTE